MYVKNSWSSANSTTAVGCVVVGIVLALILGDSAH